MRTPLAICALLLAAAASTDGAAGEVYRCSVDGRTVFTDRPCPDGERLEGLAGDAPAPAREAGRGVADAGTPARRGSEPPQFDAWTTGEHPEVLQAMADLGRRCQGGDARACQTHRLNSAQYAGNRDRNRRCAAGEARACDEIRCLAAGDRAACARLQ